jgi:hypothetical protein
MNDEFENRRDSEGSDPALYQDKATHARYYYGSIFELLPTSLITQARRFKSTLISSSDALQLCLCNQ